jgi:hypothetical protein
MAHDQPEWLLTVDGATRNNPSEAGAPRRSAMRLARWPRGSAAILAALPSQRWHAQDTLSGRAALLRQFACYRIVHFYREMNKVADRLANRGVDDVIARNSTG